MRHSGAIVMHDGTRAHDAEMGSFVQHAKCATERCSYHHEIGTFGPSLSGLAPSTTRQRQQLRSANRAHRSGPKSNMHRSARV
jgi:hypothetical protein